MSNLIYLIIGVVVLVAIVVVVVRVIKRKKSGGSVKAERYPVGEQLYVGNLSYHVNGFHLKQLFSEYGDVQTVRLIKNPKTGRSKGFAFVTYANVKDAQKALASNGRDVRGRAIVVRMAKPREEA